MNDELKKHIASINETFDSWRLKQPGDSRAYFDNDEDPEACPRALPAALYQTLVAHAGDATATLSPATKSVIEAQLGHSVTPEQVTSLLNFLGADSDRKAAISWNLPLTIEPSGSTWTCVNNVMLLHDQGLWRFVFTGQPTSLMHAARDAALISVMCGRET